MRFLFPLCLIALLALPGWGQEEPPEMPAGGQEQPAGELPAGEAAEEADRVTFNVRLSEEQGGGRAEGSAGAFEYQEGKYLIATGGVRFKYRDLVLSAERARIDVQKSLLTAEGNVVLDEGPRRLTGEALEYDLEAQTGRVVQAMAYVDPSYYFSGREIAKVGAETYTVDDGIFTSCNQEVPSWSFRLAEARVTVGRYARIKHARMRLKKLPVLYFPYILWPAKTERTSGFLMPHPGFSGRRGASLGLGYYQTLGRSADMTFVADVSAEEYYGFGTELRWRPSENSQGVFQGYALKEPNEIPAEYFHNIFDPIARQIDPATGMGIGDTRWKYHLFHETKDLWGRFRAAISLQDYSDLDFRHETERNVNRQTNNFIYSQAFLTGNFGRQSINLVVDQRQRLRAGGRHDVRRQLPELEYRLRPTRLGSTPIYFSLDANLHKFSVERGPTEEAAWTESYKRFDLAPTLSIPLSTLPWLSAKLDLGGRVTDYSTRLETAEEDDGHPSPYHQDEDVRREFTQVGFEAVGPSFSRIFEKEGGRFAKLKHIIEPRWTYGNISDFEDDIEDDEDHQIDIIPSFDEIDVLRPVNAANFALVNRILAKPADESQGGAFEIASFELAQSHSFDDERPGQRSQLDPEIKKPEGPLRALLRFNPSTYTSVKLEARYNTLFSQLQSMSFSGGTKIGQHSLGLTWFTKWYVEDLSETKLAGDPASDQARLSLSLALLPERLTFNANVSYDFKKDAITKKRRGIVQQRYFLNWKSACYSVQFEIRESALFRGANNENDKDLEYYFAFTLKNVGTFIDFDGRID